MTVEGFAIIPREVLWDATLSPKAKLVYAGLSARADRQGRCFPSHATLAADLSMGASTVREALELLRDRGLVTWSTRRRQDGGKSSNVYTIGSPPPSPESSGGSAGIQQGASLDSGDQEERESEGTRASEVPPSREVVGVVSSDELFEKFWALWPRKVAKPAARRAFDRALRRVPSPARIMLGVEAFASDPNLPGKGEERFIPHPATWLNEDRWNDPALPQRGGRPSGAQRDAAALELAARYEAEQRERDARGELAS